MFHYIRNVIKKIDKKQNTHKWATIQLFKFRAKLSQVTHAHS